jgi:magnesium-transporting ATPase (P-type)
VETLGSVTISALINRTLTENKMTVKEVYLTPDVKPKLILVKIMPYCNGIKQ